MMARILAGCDRAGWTRRDLLKASLSAGAAAALPSWMRGQNTGTSPIHYTGPDSLRAHAAARGLLYGAAVNPALLDVEGLAAGKTVDPYTQLVVGQANIVVAENAMKWRGLRPTATTFDFVLADRLMRFASLAEQRVRGHNLCWHQSLPAWFKSTVTKDNARQLLVEHIQTVAGRYRGRIQSWDVVNEAIDPKVGRPDGLRDSPWLGLIGPDYIELAFQTAAVADPTAKLTYNDYGIELDTPEQTRKRGFVLMLLRRLKARNVPIQAVGIQSHLKAADPVPGSGLQGFIREARTMVLDVYITEMDVNTRGLKGGPEAQDDPVAQLYRDYLGMVLAEPNVPAVLTWGISDAHTSLNNVKKPWAEREDGARQRPLPFDENYQPTEAFLAIRSAIDSRPWNAGPAKMPKAAPVAHVDEGYKPFAVPGSPAMEGASGAGAASRVPLPQNH